MHTRDQSNVECVKGILHCIRISMHSMLCMLKMLKMVFAAFTQHCIQSTVAHLLMSKVSKVLCTLYIGPLAPPGGKII